MAEQTRLVLSNLPADLDEALLRKHCQSCPPDPPVLTDVRVLRNKETGQARRVAFVGCKDEGTAQRLRAWLDGTWVAGRATNGSRVKAKWAIGVKERVTATQSNGSRKKFKADRAAEEGPEDTARFAHFLALMKGSKEVVPIDNTRVHDTSTTSPPDMTEVQGESSSSNEDSSQPEATANAPSAQPPVAEDASDADWLAQRKKRLADPSKDDAVDATSVEAPNRDPSSAASRFDSPSSTHETDTLQDYTRLFIRNLPFTTTESELESLFSAFSSLESVHIPLGKDKQPKGLAFVRFSQHDDAKTALEQRDGSVFQGRILHIIPAAERGGAQAASETDEASVKSRQQNRRIAASETGLNWATLYMNPDTIATQYAERLGISKSDFLDSTNSSSAVRIALAETNAIAETKLYFAKNGVNVDSLGKRGPRSRHTLLVKNLPADYDLATVKQMFAAFGDVEACLLSPSGGLAIVRFRSDDSARQAWSALSYKQVGGAVLYLERAPATIWDAPSEVGSAQSATEGLGMASKAKLADQVNDDEGNASSSVATLYVKNVSFDTTSERFAQVFARLPGFAYARLQLKSTSLRTGSSKSPLSMGYGFVGFKSKQDAEQAKGRMTGFVLDGHALDVQYAKRGHDDEAKQDGSRADRARRTNKVVIKNLPFEATRRDVKQLVSAYGETKSVRLPKKVDASTRGFAFVEFVSRSQAEAAMAALQHTHLLGRHLVLEWAQEEANELSSAQRKSVQVVSAGPNKSKFRLE